jgi:NAD(P)-dependent dehydrogenase (short-subunit alcohol dehydrogenase family)
MFNSLANKTALITGGGHRIGRAIALSLAAEKVNCVIQSLPGSGKDTPEVLKEIRAKGVEAHGIRADFSKPDGAVKIFPALREQGIRIDYLVNNASTFEKSRISDIDRLGAALTVNTFGPLVLARDFAGQSESGAIVNILDTRISGYDVEYAGYTMSKIMLLHLTRMMALEWSPGIRVNAVAPGIILPPRGKGPAYLDKIRHRTLLDRHGSTKNITDSVLFLLKNDFITGETLFVDGGEHLKRHDGSLR